MGTAGSFLDRVDHHPLALDPARGAEVWRAGRGLPPAARPLIEGAAGTSPYLAGVLLKEASWLAEALHRAPEESLAALVTAARADGQGEDLPARLRRIKRRAALLIALADLAGVWDLAEVTAALTQVAEATVEAALVAALSAEVARGRRAGLSAEDLADSAGLAVIAMGKMGAGELNYSSDIDLVCLFDEGRYAPERYGDVRKALIRVVQAVVRTLSEPTADGYVFRTDLRLRPDPAVTPVCIAMEAAERYYESVGRTWERAAYIKARAAAGAVAAGEAFLDRLQPFIFRRHLDFAAIRDAHDIRLRIRAHKGLSGPIQVPGHDLKLGRGGIREIEFFTQTRQLILGGRDPALRGRATRPMLRALAERGWIGADVAAELDEAYVRLRTLEHRLQMIHDAQTHAVPTDAETRRRLAALDGRDDLAGFEAELLALLRRTDATIEAFFEPGEASGPRRDDAGAFQDAAKAAETMERWRRLPALRSDRARRIFARLRPEIVARLCEAASPDQALAEFDAFLGGLPAGVQLFSLFEANKPLLDLLVEICAAAPSLAQYLGRNSGVLDAVLSPDFFGPLPDVEALGRALSLELARATDYEQALDATRRWQKEQHFRIGVHLLRAISSVEEVAAAYSALAEACLRGLLPHVVAHLAERHGPPPGRGAAVLALGKLGSREMTATSDLDLIIVYDAAGVEASEGRRPLPAATYYARLAKALISAITVPTAEGALYAVDMRLRPSGRQGPVAVSLSGFESYQREEAWIWEHLALTRARPVAGEPALAEGLAAAIARIRTLDRDPEGVRTGTADMRRRLAGVHPGAGDDPWEARLGPGRMLDVELLTQMGRLLTQAQGTAPVREVLADLAKHGWLPAEEAVRLARTHGRLARLQQILRVALGPGAGGAAIEAAGRSLVSLLTTATETKSLRDLRETLVQDREAAAAIVEARIGPATADAD
ncbi:MAG: bifunctional [glutamine synthetase] adenylyltransferase/[glutamine synthetase]-adenylyl-L-tyrosine phosphorylase [Pseudomonadota bacterium]